MTIYVLRIEGDDVFKIGFTDGFSIDERVKQLQTAHPRVLEVVATFEGTRSTEIALHSRYAAFHVRGEWFRLPPHAVEELVRMSTEGPRSVLQPKREPFGFLDRFAFDAASLAIEELRGGAHPLAAVNAALVQFCHLVRFEWMREATLESLMRDARRFVDESSSREVRDRWQYILNVLERGVASYDD
ncbi:MAG TPA: GIY-YIG nuclease family protein [Kofleriaceae bacterium]|nr:GIY-YIG nuclease family protein [Kofleriaceae bacterium]